jgi:polyhydroxyalkanoate synthase
MAQNSTQPTWDSAALATQLGRIAEQSQRLVQDFLHDRPDLTRLGMGDVTRLGGAFVA